MSENVIHINSVPRPLHGEDRLTLADFARQMGLKSVHLGCEHGVCGTCNVLINGQCVRACLCLAHSAEGAEVTTLEGLDDALARSLRQAFSRHHALQCGYCTPGVLIAAYDLLRRQPVVDEACVREQMSGNLCRCTGYQGIVEAILDVSNQLSDGDKEEVSTS